MPEKVIFTENPAEYQVLADLQKTYSSIFILTDSNTQKHCLPLLPETLKSVSETITISSGEENKNLENCAHIWQKLTEKEADRNSLLINLGGGMVTDIGGFAASTYKRGISYINIPTTLLGMTDASIGGKTGINFQHFKNQLGLFSAPELIIISPKFLKSLPFRELISGFAEVIKYALIADKNLWEELQDFDSGSGKNWQSIIEKCVTIKQKITVEDPFEKGLRKILNFGHTIGHALESYSIEKDPGKSLLHGEAIALGMIAETYLSQFKNNLSSAELQLITTYFRNIFRSFSITENEYEKLISLMRNDKKNKRNEIRFALLEKIGKANWDVNCTEKEIMEALDYTFNTKTWS
jgi:3-dehydroquinate synthase